MIYTAVYYAIVYRDYVITVHTTAGALSDREQCPALCSRPGKLAMIPKSLHLSSHRLALTWQGIISTLGTRVCELRPLLYSTRSLSLRSCQERWSYYTVTNQTCIPFASRPLSPLHAASINFRYRAFESEKLQSWPFPGTLQSIFEVSTAAIQRHPGL